VKMQVFSRKGFTLIELLIVIAIIALLVGILLPALSEARKVGRKSICESNIRQFGIAVNNYATDFTDRLASFTWKKGVDYGFGGAAADATQAASNQAIDILRRRAYRDDLTAIAGWIPHVLYSHLVLNDYLAQRLPEKSVACPEDLLLLRWQESIALGPAGFEALIPNVDRPVAAGTTLHKWPYSSSYSFVPAAWSPDKATATTPTVSQAAVHYQFNVPGPTANTILGLRKLSDVTFTAQKVLMYDSHSRHFDKKRQLFYGYSDARSPVLFFDASVRTYKTSDTDEGFRPATPANPAPTTFAYAPDGWEPRTRSGNAMDTVVGHYRWTREGLRGVDVGGDMLNN
jgi:prepilin-type N-terminal cleavage/methylation domain-containing protein